MNFEPNEVMFTSDTHFYHGNILKYDNSEFWSKEAREIDRLLKDEVDKEKQNELRQVERELLDKDILLQNNAIIKNWNSVVSPDKTVIHAGDFAFMPRDERKDMSLVSKRCNDILDQLNGRIILIRGNHEKAASSVKDRFYQIRDKYEIRIGKQHIVIDHYPQHEWNQCQRGSWMLHGHTHGNDNYDKSYKIENIGSMCWKYSPVSYTQLKIVMADRKPSKNHH